MVCLWGLCKSYFCDLLVSWLILRGVFRIADNADYADFASESRITRITRMNADKIAVLGFFG